MLNWVRWPISLYLHQSLTPNQGQVRMPWIVTSPLWGKRRLELSSNVLAFLRAAQGTGFCLASLRALTEQVSNSGHWWGPGVLCMLVGHWEQERSGQLATVEPELVVSQAQKKQDYEILKKIPVSLSSWENCTQRPSEVTFPPKVFRGPHDV